jgi:hypothetical protein
MQELIVEGCPEHLEAGAEPFFRNRYKAIFLITFRFSAALSFLA